MNKRLIFAILAFSAAAVLVLFSEFAGRFTSSVQFNLPNSNRLQHKIEQELKQTKELVQEFLKTSNGMANAELFKQGIALNENELILKDIELFIFNEDILCFWTSRIDLSELRFDTAKVTLQKLQSNYYFAHWVNQGTKKALILNPFYSEYSYQNKYLKNSFSAPYRGLDDYKVSLGLVYNGIPIRPVGVTDFYLVPVEDFRRSTINAFKPILQWICYILVIVGIHLLFGFDYFRRRPLLKVLGFVGIIVALRVISIYIGYPLKPEGELFGPKLFAHSSFNPSLGDFLVNAILVFICASFVYRNKSKLARIIVTKRNFIATATAPLVVVLYFFADGMFTSLVLHSTLNLETYRIFNITIYSVIGYFSIALWVASAILATNAWIKVFYDKIKWRGTLAAMAIGIFVVLILSFILKIKPTFLGFLWMVLSIGILAGYRIFKSDTISLRGYLVILCVLSAFSVAKVSHYSFQKEEDVRKVLAINLSSERDPLAEVLFAPLYHKLHTDTLVRKYIREIDKYNVELYSHLRKNYFRNYLNRYELRATVCLPNSFVTVDVNNTLGCNFFFNSLIDRYGTLIPSSRFFYLNLQNGSISYIGEIGYRFGDELRNLYIEIDSRPSWELLGYPELLIDGKRAQSALKGYSWAKYHKGILITQAGDFPYRLKFDRDESNGSTYQMINYLKYNHLVYKPNSEDAIVISRPRELPLNTTASFVYNLIFFFVTLLVLLKINSFTLRVRSSNNSFKNRISWAISLIIVLSMVMVATATILYNIKSFDQRNEKNLSEKLLSVMFELDKDIMLIYRPNNSDLEQLNDRLIELSNIFYTDINIYNTSGMLLATSRPEMFEKQLLGPRMNPVAWHEMAFSHSPKFVDTESIGSMSFLSAYVPIVGSNGETIAYLNLPYFTKQEELRSELYSIIVAIINIYALLALFAIIVAVLISVQITRPLELIRERISMVNIAGHNELIEYSGNDEVGQLIREYNRMVEELAWSAKELARNQRESAWREMAKQIAHEVKNPLTPIKLSLQYLVKAKKDGVPDWDQRFQKFSESLVEQINTLTNIANEFSSFAKLPNANISEVNLYKILTDIVTLYSGYKNMSITLTNKLSYEPTVMADREQLLRVFNNLVKNAIQSVERGKQGVININILLGFDKSVRVEVRDNGSGIPDDVLPKLFTPNFTTKSGGTGLGLAITREIVLGFGGNIKVNTTVGEGSSFTVELPLGKLNEEQV